MSSSTKSTIKFALLAYSVYCWVDGSTRTQTSQNSDLTFELLQELQRVPERSQGWKALWEWMSGHGSRMSEEERSALGRMDVIVSFFLFNSLQRLPFRATSIQAPSLPRLANGGRLRWKVLVLTAALLSLAHETQRAAVIYYLRQRRTNQTHQLRKDLDNMRIGQVSVQGDCTIPQPEGEDGDEEEECLICSGSADTMSTSSHADNTMTTRMGPLEAFCTIAPQKHLAHRQCFLRWHTAYLQQSRHSLGNTVTLLGDAPTPLHQLVIRASVILQASGFDYLAPRLVQQTEEEPQLGDSLTIHTPSTPHLLATLRTCAPPCPGCRSPVRLRFVDARPPLASHTSSAPPQRIIPLFQKIVFSRFWRAWSRTVTGRSISAYFSSLLSFMAVLAMITRVRGNPAWVIKL